VTHIGGGGICAISGRVGIYDERGRVALVLSIPAVRCLQMQRLPVKKDSV